VQKFRRGEAYALFNPAFFGILLRRFIDGHVDAGATAGVPYVLPFVAIPMAVAPDVRSRLSYSTASHLGAWVQTNPNLMATIAPFARALVPYVRMGILLGAERGLVSFDDGELAPGPVPLPKPPSARAEGDLAECQRAARFLGRWFAKYPDPSSILALLGVKP